MPRLTQKQVNTITQPGRYSDLNGLSLLVSASKKGNIRRSWTQRLRINGHRKDRGLGSVADITLRDARELALQNSAVVARGESPWPDIKVKAEVLTEPAENGAPTFERMAREFHAGYDKLTNPKNRKNWLHRAEKYLFPAIGRMPVDQIKRRTLLDLLVPISREKPETAKRLSIIAKQTLNHAVTYEYMEYNPADQLLTQNLLPPKPEHHASVHYDEVPCVIAKVMDSEARPVTKLAFVFQVLNAVRPNEVRFASWSEIDIDAELWTIPAERMKSRRAHVVPLSVQSIVILNMAKETLGGDGLIFPSPSGNSISENTLSDRMEKMGLRGGTHGFRSSFSNFARARMDASWETVELCLAHRIGGTTAQAYFSDQLLDKRRPLMQEWGNYIWDISPF